MEVGDGFLINIPLCLIGLWACYKISRVIKRNTSITYRCIRKYILHFKRLAISFWFLSWIKCRNEKYIYMGIYHDFNYFISYFLIHESKVKHPIIDVHLCQHSNFIVPIFATVGFGVASAIILSFHLFPTSIYAINSLANRICFIISPAWFSNIFANSRKIHGTFWAKITYENRFMCYVYSICWIKLYPSPLVTIYNGELITSIWGWREFSSLLILHQL